MQTNRTPVDGVLDVADDLVGWARRSRSWARDTTFEIFDETKQAADQLAKDWLAVRNRRACSTPEFPVGHEQSGVGRGVGRFAKQLFSRGAKSAVERWYSSIQMPNQGWSMLWIIDYVCTLKCVYCGNADVTVSSTNDESREKALELMYSKRPGYLTISGGEPVLIPDLVELLRELNQRLPSMAITLNSSLIVKDVDIYQRILPYIKTLYVSLDGLGQTNKSQRGVSGDLVFKRIEHLLPHAQRLGVNIFVNAVITINNYDKVVELFEALDRLSPEINLGVAPIVPFDDPLSVFEDPAKMEVFFAQYNQLREKYGDTRIQFNGYPKSSVHCYSQYLDAFLYPDAAVKSCAEKKFSHDFNARFFFDYVRKNWKTDYVNIAKFMTSFALRQPSAICFQPCNTSARTNQVIHKDRDFREALFSSSHTIEAALVGSLLFLKYDLLRRKMIDRFFTPDSGDFFFSGVSSKELTEFTDRYDYHEVFYVKELPLSRVRYKVVERGRLHVKIKPYFRDGRKVHDDFPVYTLININGAWKVRLRDLIPERKRETADKLHLAVVDF